MNFIEFINPGILLKDVPLNLISDLNFELQNIKKIPYNQKLAGNIKNEYEFSNAHNILNDFLLNTCEEYNKKYGSIFRASSRDSLCKVVIIVEICFLYV